MTAIRIESVTDPFESPEAARAAVEAIVLSEAMGLLPEDLVVSRLDAATVRAVARAVGKEGLAPNSVAELVSARWGRGTLDALRELRQALEDSPIPRTELGAMMALFGPDRLAELLETSVVSVRRYAVGSRKAPDDVAERAHFLAKVVADLRGAYNEVGVRRWFDRRRTQLGGKAPATLLRGRWKPESKGPSAVRALARSLVGAGAT
jgi:hypothetical protein